MSKRAFFGGLAVFAMFFGSGNLIFPLVIGRESQGHWLAAIFGLGITGVLLPLFGLLAMLFFKNNMEAFFEGLFNKLGASMASLVILLLCGPLGVIPRCITVAQGAWKTFSPNGGNVIFVAVCCAVIWCCVYFKSDLVDLIGKYFTPIKLTGLLTIIFSSIFVAVATHKVSTSSHSSEIVFSSFTSGLINGYGTMDLFGALFFGPTIIAYFTKNSLSKSQINRECSFAMVFGFLLIFFIYSCLIYLGAAYSTDIANTKPTEILPAIVSISLGKYSNFLVSITLIVATLVTAIALTSVTVDYLSEKIQALRNSKTLILNISIAITFILAVMGFEPIMSFLMPILKVFYPLTILILIINAVLYIKKEKDRKRLHIVQISEQKTYIAGEG